MTSTYHKTRVSETIRKAPLAEAQITLGKQKSVLWNAVSVPLPKFCEKKLFPTQNLTESGNRLLRYGQRTTFKTSDVRHLEFLKCS